MCVGRSSQSDELPGRDLEFWRFFMRDNTGGAEIAPMSTTTDVHVAARYGLGQGSLLFKLKVANFMQYGAELQWLSAFPHEAEVLYPPLTFLQPMFEQRIKDTDTGKVITMKAFFPS